MGTINNGSTVAGTLSYLKWAKESTYNTPVTATLAFGHGQKLTAQAAKNNMERIWQLGARNAQKSPAKQFEGTFSVEWVLSSGNFWTLVMGGASSDSGAGPYTHTYAEANTIPSFTMEDGVDLDTDAVRNYSGCAITNFTLSAAVGELIKCKADGWYANEALTTSVTSVVTDSEEPFIFSEGLVELPSGTTVARVQNIEISINQNSERVPQLGSRFTQQIPVKKREYNIKMTAMFTSSALLLLTYGASSAPASLTVAQAGATLVLTFDNALASTSSRKHVLTLTNVFFDESSIAKDPNELIKEDITAWALSGSVVWTNNTATG